MKGASMLRVAAAGATTHGVALAMARTAALTSR